VTRRQPAVETYPSRHSLSFFSPKCTLHLASTTLSATSLFAVNIGQAIHIAD
jgi:hypothetical protein